MTLDPDLLSRYVQAIITHGLHLDDSTIDCGGSPCNDCPLTTAIGDCCELNEVANSNSMNYSELECIIIQPIIKQTHPELFV